ncbi:MAG: hypothetical protein ACI93R_000048 [Flavobacteriales bacterium]|jgi:hypothetical protein
MVDETVLSDDLDDNYEIFIVQSLAMGCIWGLESEEGFALCPSVDNEEIDVMPLWSQPEFAKLHAKDEWEGYKVVPIAVEEFLDDWLPGMHGDTMLVGVNWNDALEGLEMEPLDILENIDNAREDFE